MGSHTGTHIDAPYHINDNKKKINEIDLKRVMGRGRIIDASNKGPGEAITLSEVREGVESFNKNEIALFYTGWDRYIGEEMYYNHPYVDKEIIETLLSRGVTTFFIDTLNINTPKGDNFDAHELITNENGIIGENFSNIGAIDFADPWITALPLKLTDLDGSPVRAVAFKIE